MQPQPDAILPLVWHLRIKCRHHRVDTHLHRVAVDDDLLGARLAPRQPLFIGLLARQHARVAAGRHQQPRDAEARQHAAAGGGGGGGLVRDGSWSEVLLACSCCC